jgi:murein DD-endopeptidase MepM/ murein hydrolase activator NlpD
MFVKSPKHNINFGVKIACSLLAVILLVLVSRASSRVDAQTTAEQHIYAPLVSSGSVAQTQPSSVAEVSQQDEWLVYESLSGGYSFSYPATYTLKEHEQGFIQLQPVGNDAPDSIITLMYLYYEIEPTDEILAWARLYDTHHKDGAFIVDFAPANLDTANLDASSQQLYVESTADSSLPMQAFLITNHRLVLRASAHQLPGSDIQTLRQIAQSVTFLADAPQNLTELFAPEPLPSFGTFQALFDYNEEGELVNQALEIRIVTGEVPTEILDQLSEQGKRRYEVALEAQADIVQEWDRQRADPPPTGTEYSEDDYQRYLESEAEYNQTLSDNLPPDEINVQNDEPELSPAVSAAGTQAISTWGTDNRKGLPARYVTPTKTYVGILCGSGDHFSLPLDTYAADVQVTTGTQVFATSHGETVTAVVTNYSGMGYGRHVKTDSKAFSAGVERTYNHIYAHLDTVAVAQYNVLDPSMLIGTSGSTGTTGAHLHFGISTIVGGVAMPVDLSPIKGLMFDLDYPIVSVNNDCGSVGDPNSRPLIIEANEYEFWYQPVSGGYNWSCSTYLPNHTGTCYRAVIPLSPTWGMAPLTYSNVHLTPRISYRIWIPVTGNYRVWVCGMGGNANDDSLHIGQNSSLLQTADDMHEYNSTNWVWKSVRMNNTTPYLYLQSGYNNIDMYARENGMRVDRILLTRDYIFHPASSSIRCGGQGL